MTATLWPAAIVRLLSFFAVHDGAVSQKLTYEDLTVVATSSVYSFTREVRMDRIVFSNDEDNLCGESEYSAQTI